MTLGQLVYQLVTEAIASGGWMEMDRLYLQNKVLAMIGAKEMDHVTNGTNVDLDTVIEQLIDIARENAVVTHAEKEEELKGQLYDLITPPPSVLNALFAQRYNSDKKEATDDFYTLSLKNHNIKEKNYHQTFETTQGRIWTAVTSGTAQDNVPVELSNYPACPLCFDNEGYVGEENHLVRASFRYIRMNLQGASFGFKYAPYQLWSEHCLFVSEVHGFQMHSRQAVDQLLQIAEVFPQYFVATESDLLPNEYKPQHVVYHGGIPNLPIFNRSAKATFNLSSYPDMDVEVLDYPLTTCHFVTKKRNDLLGLVTQIIQAWRLYQDDGLSAFSSNGELNHSLNLIACQPEEGMYEMYVIFRDIKKTSFLHLAQVLGVEPTSKASNIEAQALADQLVNADPFGNQPAKIDHWMQKINRLGENE